MIRSTAIAGIEDGLIVYFPLDDGKGTTVKDFSGNGYGGGYPRNEWVHLVVLADSSSTKYYINGKPAGNQGGPAALNISTSLHIGARFSKAESFLSILYDIAIWNRIISEKEIEQANKGPIISTTAVSPAGKLSVTWAEIKSEN